MSKVTKYKGYRRRAPYSKLKLAMGLATEIAKAYTQTRARTDADTNGQTTNPTDSAVTQYRAKKRGKKYRRYKKKAFKAFVKQQLKLVGSNVCVLNDQGIGGLVSQPGNQDFVFLTLGGKSFEPNQNDQIGQDDIRRVMGADDRLLQNVNNTKCVITSSKMDITAINNGNVPIEVDMYIIQHYGNNHLASYREEAVLAQNRTPLPPQTGGPDGSDPSLRTRGMTLFDLPMLSQMGNKIIKKVKFILPITGTITHTIYGKKNVWFSSNDLLTDQEPHRDHYVKHGYTKTVAFIYKPVTSYSALEASLSVGVTRSYNYRIFQDNRAFNVYNPN